MADGEDWRRQRALQLGLEPLAVSPPARPSSVADSQLQAPGGETDVVTNGVCRMRLPSGGDSDVPEITQRIEPFKPRTTEIDLPALVKPVRNFGNAGPHREPRAEAQIKRKRRASPFLVGAGLVAATVGGWLAEQQTRPSKSVSAPVTIAAAQSIRPAESVSAISATGSVQPDSSFPVDAVPELPSCAATAIINQLRSMATEQLRRSGLLRTSSEFAVDIAKPHIRIAAAGSALAVCTAALQLRRPDRTAANFDLDYAIRLPSGLPAQVVPLGLDRIVDRIQPDDLNAQVALVKNHPVVVTASTPDTAAATTSRPVSPPSSTAVAVTEAVSPVPVAAPPERGGVSTTAIPTADSFDMQAKVPKTVLGCEQPATVSVAITCRSPALLAFNAEVAASLSALDHSGNTVELARIKQHAEQHFNRCTTPACVASVYHYWLNALRKIRLYEAKYSGSGPGSATERAPN